jgi:hypothetical protein
MLLKNIIMKLSDFKAALKEHEYPIFKLENGKALAPHYHLTELGKITKDYIDCGGNHRQESWLNLQLWEANDYEHRLSSTKLLRIIRKTERQLALSEDFDLEIEYQGSTIGRYTLDREGETFLLKATQTDCLAKDSCGIPDAISLPVKELASAVSDNCCGSNSTCC